MRVYALSAHHTTARRGLIFPGGFFVDGGRATGDDAAVPVWAP
jgi:hypothetical protein